MKGSPDWLPPLVLFNDYSGDWNAYLEALYACFRQDFIDTNPVFQGRRLGLKRHPMADGKEATFWHMIQEGKAEQERIPDLRRCERIRWPKPIIEHDADPAIKVWRNQRVGNKGCACGLSGKTTWSFWRIAVSTSCLGPHTWWSSRTGSVNCKRV